MEGSLGAGPTGAVAAVGHGAAGETVRAGRPPGRPFSARRSARPATPLVLVLSSALGFVAGALFWHMVGFWSFVNEAVFYQRADGVAPAPASRTAIASMKSQSRQAGVAGPVQAPAGNCSVALLDRAGGDILVAACDGAGVKFQPPRGIARAGFADFGPVPVPVLISGGNPSSGDAPAVSGWSARVESLEGSSR